MHIDRVFRKKRKKSNLDFGTVFRSIALGWALVFLGYGCDLCEYSPYEARGIGKHANLNFLNTEKIECMTPASPDSFCFAFLTDTHSHYGDFINAIRSINDRPEIMFVIHGGDMTDRGIRKEYAWAAEIITECRAPFFSVLGNHDCLSNGKKIYGNLFGATCYSFELELRDDREIRFVILNDNTLEYDYRNSQAVFFKTWLESALDWDDDCCGIIVAAHVPPFNPHYFDDATEEYYRSLLAARGVILSLHGHEHRHLYEQYYGDGVWYLVGDDIRDRVYYLITIYTKDRISFNVTSCHF
jgi:3',5'-cyclic AMP phosphodiesterase CpdA